jgi:hypothetical protein
VLASATAASADAAIGPFDIATEPDPGKRATAFFPIVSAVVNDLDKSPEDNVKRFLMHVAWHESARLRHVARARSEMPFAGVIGKHLTACGPEIRQRSPDSE